MVPGMAVHESQNMRAQTIEQMFCNRFGKTGPEKLWKFEKQPEERDRNLKDDFFPLWNIESVKIPPLTSNFSRYQICYKMQQHRNSNVNIEHWKNIYDPLCKQILQQNI